MFDYTRKNQQISLTQSEHKGYHIYTKIEDIIRNKSFLVEVPSIFMHLRNIRHLPEDEQKYILSLLDSDPYDDIYRFVRTRVTPKIIIEIYELHYPFEIVNDKDLLELSIIFRLYVSYLQENFLQFQQRLQQNQSTNGKKDSIVLQQAQQKLSTIREIADILQHKAYIIVNKNPSLKNRYPLLNLPSISIADLLKMYESLSLE